MCDKQMPERIEHKPDVEQELNEQEAHQRRRHDVMRNVFEGWRMAAADSKDGRSRE